ncbi:hypothetical protein, partial [Candidatus Tokpelaia sp.]|uniref:hypothetical protein n=1 Tax=Candidatus Tokpelaia sp. TaxID=2233777 RepID=UPI00126C5893
GIGAAVGLGGHALLNNWLSRKGLSQAENAVLNMRDKIADKMRVRRAPTNKEQDWAAQLKNIDETLKKGGSTATDKARQERAMEVLYGKPVRDAWNKGEKPKIRANAETARGMSEYEALVAEISKRDGRTSDAAIDRVMPEEIAARDAAKKNFDAWKKVGKSEGYTQAKAELDRTQSALDAKRKRLEGMRQRYIDSVYAGTPIERELSRVNPAARYGRETGAARANIGDESVKRNYTDNFDLAQAQAVLRNAGLEENQPYQRAMWQGDRDIRNLADIGQEDAENLFSRLAQGTEDPITGKAVNRPWAGQARQGQIYEGNKQDFLREVERGGVKEDGAASRFIRPDRSGPLKDWTPEQRQDLRRLLRDGKYTSKVLEGKAEVREGG